MQKRDLWSAAVGAALAAGAMVGTRALTSSAARSGDPSGSASGNESTLAGSASRSRSGSGAGGRGDLDASLTPRPLEEANENLVEQVHEYQRRLDAIAGEKAMLEASLKKTEEKLAAAQSDGGLGKRRNEFDLTQDEWKERGSARMPASISSTTSRSRSTRTPRWRRTRRSPRYAPVSVPSRHPARRCIRC